VLQSPVSDREYIVDTFGKEKHAASLKIARNLVAQGHGHEPVPSEYSDMFSGGKCTINAERWLSLAAPYSSQSSPSDSEDYFSSDHEPKLLRSLLGRIGDAGVPVAIFFSGRDESMPSSINKPNLLKKFLGAVEGTEPDSLSEKLKDLVMTTDEEKREKISEHFSELLSGAGHVVEEEPAQSTLVYKVTEFAKTVGRNAP